MSHFLRHSELRPKKQQTEDFQVLLAMSIRHRFRDEVAILESEEAADRIREHQDCPFRKFVFSGECEIEREWYYIAANGSLFSPTTQVILLRKDTSPKKR